MSLATFYERYVFETFVNPKCEDQARMITLATPPSFHASPSKTLAIVVVSNMMDVHSEIISQSRSKASNGISSPRETGDDVSARWRKACSVE